MIIDNTVFCDNIVRYVQHRWRKQNEFNWKKPISLLAIGAFAGFTLVSCEEEEDNNDMMMLGALYVLTQGGGASAKVTKNGEGDYSANVAGYKQTAPESYEEDKEIVKERFEDLKAIADNYTECEETSDYIQQNYIDDIDSAVTEEGDYTKYEVFSVSDPVAEVEKTIKANKTAATEEDIANMRFVNLSEYKQLVTYLFTGYTSDTDCATKLKTENQSLVTAFENYSNFTSGKEDYAILLSNCEYGAKAPGTYPECATLSEEY